MSEDLIDRTNEDPEYWEKILAKNNLSMAEEPETFELTAEEFKELSNLEALPEEKVENEDEPAAKFNGLTRDTMAELRTKMDGDDPFFTGHQIIKIRRSNRERPDWVTDNEKLQKILLSAFPKLSTDPKHRAGAGRWARVIQMYFKSQMTEGQVAKELNLKLDALKAIKRSIIRTAKGQRTMDTKDRKRNMPRLKQPIEG